LDIETKTPIPQFPYWSHLSYNYKFLKIDSLIKLTHVGDAYLSWKVGVELCLTAGSFQDDCLDNEGSLDGY